ncbi:MAG: enoyl-CoA hydratase/isomerase family protein [Thermodesulfobacteriota bacterium]
MEKTVLYRREKNIGMIILNRPHRLNAINDTLLKDLIEQLKNAGDDEKAGSIILTGAGKSFCAGEDLKETSAGKTMEEWLSEINGLQETQSLIMKLGKPIIAAVNGYAVGGGLEFALSCDIRIAADDAKFGFPETGVGLTVTNSGTKLIAQIVGLGKAKELVLTGDIIGSKEALKIGLVNKVVPRKELMNEALRMCKKLAEKSPLSLRLTRIAIDQGLHSSFEQIMEIEAGHMMLCVASGSQKEFVAKKLRKMKK